MTREEVVERGPQWPGEKLDKFYWISLDPMQARIQHDDDLVILSREGGSLAEHEPTAAEFRTNLDAALEPVRCRLR